MEKIISHGNKERAIVRLFVVLMVFSMLPWFVYFYLSDNMRMIIGVMLAFGAFCIDSKYYSLSSKTFGIAFLYVVASLIMVTGNINAYIGGLLRCIPFLLFLCLRDNIKEGVLDYFNKVFSWILVISLVFWALHLIGIPLSHATWSSDERIYSYENYYFFIEGTYVLSSFPRFCSIFLEPGYIACYMALLLYLNRYDFKKWYNIVFLISLILTFSLAGWMFFFILLIPYLTGRGKTKWGYLIISIIFIGIFAYFNYSDSNNAVSVLIGDRIKMENGRMAGYNRSSLAMDDYWNNYFWKSDDIWWGMRDGFVNDYDFGASVDGRAFIMKNGLIAAIVYLLLLIKCYTTYRSRWTFWYFLVFFLFVYRGHSIMFNDTFLILYVAGLIFLINNRSIKKQNSEGVMTKNFR